MSKLLVAVLFFFLPVAGARAAWAGAEACGGALIPSSATCKVEKDCSSSCPGAASPTGYSLACAAKLYGCCAQEKKCVTSPDAACLAECKPGCTAMCGGGAINCTANCAFTCGSECDKFCVGKDAPCVADCKASCFGECRASCEPPAQTGVTSSSGGCDSSSSGGGGSGGSSSGSASSSSSSSSGGGAGGAQGGGGGDAGAPTCDAICALSCDGSCAAAANRDCFVTECEIPGAGGCASKLNAACLKACDGSSGVALFCDGEYIEVGNQLQACVDYLSSIGVVITFPAPPDPCATTSCTPDPPSQDQGSCNMRIARAPLSDAAPAAAALVLAALGLFRRRGRR